MIGDREIETEKCQWRKRQLIEGNNEVKYTRLLTRSVRNMQEIGRAATMKAVKMTNTNRKMELKKRNEGMREMRRAAMMT